MFIVQLRFSDNKAQAGQYMEAHKAWIQQGFEDGVFLMVGSIKPGLGGVVIAHNLSADALQSRVNDDPFVAENVVRADIIEIDPARADERLAFLLD